MKVEWNAGLFAHLGIEFVEVTPDRVVARLKVSDKLMTVGGTIHGGGANTSAPQTFTTSCNASTTWLAQNVNNAGPAGASERGR